MDKKANKNMPITAVAGYKGTVNVAIKNDFGTILYQGAFHNKGCKTLFRFLCECLAGNYNNAEKFRPIKIKIFSTDLSIDAIKDQFNNGDFDSNITPLSGEITTDTVAKVQENNEKDGFDVSIHFMIPFTHLLSLDKDIKIMMLYPSSQGRTSGTNANNLIAYYLCSAVDETTKEEIWDPIKVSEIKDDVENVNLIIEWKMSILNIN